MLAKVLVLIFVAGAICEDHGYTLKAVHHEPQREYRHRYERIPARVQEEQDSSNGQHYSSVPESHGHAYSSQSVIHHPTFSVHEASQESGDEHVAPVYQYVQEEEEVPAHHVTPAKHYQTIRYPAPAPVHHDHAPQPHDEYHIVKPHSSVHVEPHYSHGTQEQEYQHASQQHAQQDIPHVHDSHDEPIDYYAYPKYQYEYKVEDPHTGDNKFQHEYRDGDVVKGVYSLLEADGSIRTVEYSSDKHHGFNAIVKHSAPGQHVQVESHHQN